MLQLKDFVKCGSPEKPYELHVSHEQMEELIKRDIAMERILELRDGNGEYTQNEVFDELINATEKLKR
jgi:hypothetical protein